MNTAHRVPAPRALLAATTVVVAALGVACGGGSNSSSVKVGGAWARASANMQTNGAAYLVIDGGSEADSLVGVTVPTDVAAVAELHETVTSSGDDHGSSSTGGHGDDHDGGGMGDHGDMDGMMGMRQVTSIAVPAGGEVALEPGGFHVMLIDLAGPLEAGASFDLTLQFERAGTVVVPVEVRS